MLFYLIALKNNRPRPCREKKKKLKEEKEFIWCKRKGAACERGAMDKAMGSKII